LYCIYCTCRFISMALPTVLCFCIVLLEMMTSNVSKQMVQIEFKAELKYHQFLLAPPVLEMSEFPQIRFHCAPSHPLAS